MRRLIAIVLAASALLAGCSGGGNTSTSHLQVTDTLTAASPASSPPVDRPAAGTVFPAPASSLTVFDPVTHTLALAGAKQPTLTLFDTRAMGRPPRTIDLPGVAASLRTTPDGGTLLATLPGKDLVARIDVRSGDVRTVSVAGAPVDAIATDGHLVVARRDRNDVAVVDDGRVLSTTGGFKRPTRLLRQGGRIFVLDSLTTSLTPVDTAASDTGAALRAGEGATHAVTDRFGRILVVDTRGEELMAFSTDPWIMKQRYPVPGSPFGLAYDPARDLAWVTLTARNELVAYDVAGGQPRERYRVPTVRQPNSVTVDPATGKVYVTSAVGQGVQVVKV